MDTCASAARVKRKISTRHAPQKGKNSVLGIHKKYFTRFEIENS